MRTVFFAWRMLRRDARAGESFLLAAALVVAVAALTAIGFFTDRVRQALDVEAGQLLGADLLLTADHPWPSALAAQAAALDLRVAETRTFPSMASTGEGEAFRVQLADVKAVSADYPLRGRLRTAPALNVPDAPASGVPRPGGAWVDARLASALAVGVGDAIRLGEKSLHVDAILSLEPDRGINFFSVAPRLLMNLADLGATGLIQPGSRVAYRMLLAGDPERVATLKRALEASLGRGERIEDVQNARPEIRAALERAQCFLGLSALLTVVLAAVAVVLAARRYGERHLDPCAVMRCLGMTQGRLLRMHLYQFAILGLLAALIGVLAGYAAHFVLHAWLAHLLATPLPQPGLLPAAQGVVLGLFLLFGFSLPHLLQLKKVSTLRVFRREFSVGRMPSWRLLSGYACGLVGLAGLMFWLAGEVRLGGWVVAGFVAAAFFFALIARLAIRLAAVLRRGAAPAGFGWRYGLAALERRATTGVAQIVALSLGFMALFLLTAVRGELMTAWQDAVPPEAPNRFVINVQPGQLADVREFFAREGVGTEFAPMIRGRLTRINGVAVDAEKYADDRARRLIEREFNLSYRMDLPPGNTLSAGRWFESGDAGEGVASIEEGLAKTLGLKLGDALEFTVAGKNFAMKIVGLRKLNWDSMRVNFFVLTPPVVLESYPASWITSFHLGAGREDFVNRLVREFPNLTVIDVATIVRQLQTVIGQVARAVQFIFLFTLAAGFVVLYAALSSAADERRYELAVMRALGAQRRQLRKTLFAEFAAVGALSGLIAALGALAVGQVLARTVFNLELPVDYRLPFLGALGAAALIAAAGGFASGRLMRGGALESLRAGG